MKQRKSFLNTFQDAFDESVVDAAKKGANEAAIIAGLEPAFDEARKGTAATLLTALKGNAPEMLRVRRAETTGFERRNFRRWRKAFDLLEMLIVMAEEIGQENDKALRAQARKDRDFKFEAIAHIHPKAVLIAREIQCLLRGGYPDAALTRWRTLYELSVVAHFLQQNDQVIALRYLASERFQALRAIREHNAHAQRANLRPFSNEDIAALENVCGQLEAQIGGRLKKDYDWAHPALVARQPSLMPDKVDFSQIEKNVEMDHWRPRYRLANRHIHSSHRSPGSLLGTVESKRAVMLVGPSNSGFVDPFQMTAMSLVHVATLFLLHAPNLDRIVMIDMLEKLSDEIASTAIELEKTSLAAEHRKVRRATKP